jgi:hypothetical protein
MAILPLWCQAICRDSGGLMRAAEVEWLRSFEVGVMGGGAVIARREPLAEPECTVWRYTLNAPGTDRWMFLGILPSMIVSEAFVEGMPCIWDRS